MITKIDKETVQFICKHRMTFQQFAICLLIYHKDTIAIEQINAEVAVIGDCLVPVAGGYKKELEDLVDRGYLFDYNKPNDYHLDNYVLTPKFTHNFLVDISKAPQEAWDSYPKFLIVDNKEITTKTCTYEEFTNEYLKAIQWNIEEHEMAMKHIKLIKSRSRYASVGIKKWAGARLWKEEQLDQSVNKVRLR